MRIITQLVPKEWKKKRPGYLMSPIYLTIHSTGNPKSTAKNEADYVTKQNPDMSVSYHYVVDEKEAYNVIPPTEVAWHAGDGGSGTGNRKSVGIEICESGDRKKTLLNAIELVTMLMTQFEIKIENIKQHNNWSGKNCPRILRDPSFVKDELDWNWFITELKKKVEVKPMPTTPAKPVATEHWAKKYLDSLAKKGIITNPEVHTDLEAPVTKGQLFSLLDKIINMK